MEQASDDLCPSAVLTATNRGEGRPFLHQPPWSCSSGMKQPFESGPAGARTGPGKKIRAMLGNKVERKRAVRRHERTMPSNVRTFDNPQSQLRIRVPSHEQIRRFLGVIRSISKPAGEQTMGTALGWYWKGTTGRASWALGRREEGEMIVRTTQVDATVCIRTWDRTAQKVGTSGGLPRNARRVKENKTRRSKSLGGSSEHNRGDRAHHRF